MTQPTQCTIVVGETLEDAITIGPFANFEDATRYAETECRHETWNVLLLYPVRALVRLNQKEE